MRVSFSILSASLAFSIFSQAYAQTTTDTPTERPAACLWESVSLYDQPGSKKSVVAIRFGERLTLTGEAEKYTDNRTYVHARSEEGKEGWIHDYLVAPNGTAVVVLEDADIYERPNTVVSITGMKFVAGEVVVMDDFRGDWVHLIAPKRKREGWVKKDADEDIVSTDPNDLAAAALITKAQKDTLSKVRLARLEALRESPIVAQSQMKPMLEQRIAAEMGIKPATKPATLPQPAATRGMENRGEDKLDASTARLGAPNTRPTQPLQPSLSRTEITDIATGNQYQKYTEVGRVMAVDGHANRSNELFCYHKTLPVGTVIHLILPDGNGSYLSLQVADRLSKNADAAIALSEETVWAIFGKNSAPASRMATLVYYEAK